MTERIFKHADIVEIPCTKRKTLRYLTVDGTGICLICSKVGGEKVEKANARRLQSLWNAAADTKLQQKQLDCNVIQKAIKEREEMDDLLNALVVEKADLVKQVEKLKKENARLSSFLTLNNSRFGIEGDFTLENMYEMDARLESCVKALKVFLELHEGEVFDAESWNSAMEHASQVLAEEEHYKNAEKKRYEIKQSARQSEATSEDITSNLRTIEKKSWDEFRASGFLWWINMILHTFGWAIVIQEDGLTGELNKAYPVVCRYRGFSEASNDKGYKKVIGYLKSNIDNLLTETLKHY